MKFENNNSCYPFLEREMRTGNISKEIIATSINKSLRTIENRMSGVTDWQWAECVTIHDKHFPNVPIKQLFEKRQKSA